MKGIKTKNYSTLYGMMVILAVWYTLDLIIDSSIIPSPYETFKRFVELIKNGELLIHVGVSIYRIAFATIISLVLGVSLGLFLGMHEKYDELVSPIIYLLYPIPKVAFLPVFMILFGIGNTSKIVLIIGIIFFQILVTTRDAIKGLSKELFYSVKSLGANKIQMYRHLIFPAVLPKVLTALRLSVGTSIAVLFFAENFATHYGIGYFILDRWTRVSYTEMFAGILAVSLLGLILFKLIDFMEKRLCKWIVLEKVKDGSVSDKW
ncbi:ABC transporter permease [Thermohalobacter berrensis]|uniref:ABC transporter permease n=1 Tax=Thermohalobacter berrensis TaxID=99594 RepID=A0A419T192_9FIRM|nr:ABC transporter permease [Thermohalobacter berrensis]RKD31232.1 ABC transporter permease [Thermohalobacter berrensis]